MLAVLSLCAFLVSTLGFPDYCPVEIQGYGLSLNFNETIAHAIHSMTGEGLRLFNPLASINTIMPTVNRDLKKLQKVVNVPEVLLGQDFHTRTMNALDSILSEIGHPVKDGLGANWSPIERVAHTFHMWDLWKKVKTVLDDRVIPEPPSAATCSCLLQVKKNGIHKAVQWIADHYAHGTPITLLNRPIPKLVDAKSWAVWKDRLLHYYTPDALFDAATYMYCATNL